jgi:hypothetical protein
MIGENYDTWHTVTITTCLVLGIDILRAPTPLGTGYSALFGLVMAVMAIIGGTP